MPIKVIQWDLDAWEDYLYWQSQDKKNLKKINKLLKDISRNPFEGIGKPEPLKENLTGFWSRRMLQSRTRKSVREQCPPARSPCHCRRRTAMCSFDC